MSTPKESSEPKKNPTKTQNSEKKQNQQIFFDGLSIARSSLRR
jgi:hypothetical protein